VSLTTPPRPDRPAYPVGIIQEAMRNVPAPDHREQPYAARLLTAIRRQGWDVIRRPAL
jgi:hypothetical protein